MADPLTPENCDLRDFPRMMLDIPRLRGSDFDATLDDGAWRAGLNLWMSAWHQMPAASLSNDDASLAKAAGLGRDIRSWKKVKPIALRGWTECSDGNLYHPVIAELALEAWIDKLGQRLSSGAGNAKRYGTDFDPSPLYVEIKTAATMLGALNTKSRSLTKQHVQRALKDVPPKLPVGDNDGHSEFPLGSQENGTDLNGLISEAIASSVAEGDGEQSFATLWSAYPHVKGRSSKPKSEAAWLRVPETTRGLLAAAAGRYARGGTIPPGGAPAMQKWLDDELWRDWLDEGPLTIRTPWSGPADVRAAFANQCGEDWCVSYIDPSDWRDVPARTLVATPFALSKINDALRAMAKSPPSAVVGLTVILKDRAA